METRKMNKRIASMIAIAMVSVTLSAAQDKAPAADAAKPLIDAIGSIGSIIAGAGAVPAVEAGAVVEKDGAAARTAEPAPDAAAAPAETKGEPTTAAKGPRSMKNSVILVTTGTAAGAAIGGAMGKGSKAAMIGAALGGAVGLVYDRMTYKNPGKI